MGTSIGNAIERTGSELPHKAAQKQPDGNSGNSLGTFLGNRTSTMLAKELCGEPYGNEVGNREGDVPHFVPL